MSAENENENVEPSETPDTPDTPDEPQDNQELKELSKIQQVRFIIQDTEIGFYWLSDEEIQFFLSRNSDNVDVAAMAAAKAIVFKLAQRGSSSVDIFSIRGDRTAEQYSKALKEFIKDPSSNPWLNTASMYVGGVSKSDMLTNDNNKDNNFVQRASVDRNSDYIDLSGFTFNI